MAVNHNVNPRPLTAEEKENRARGIYDSFATYVVFCGHCRHVRKTNMYIMRAEAFIDELKARGEVCPQCGRRSGRSATRWARPPASSSSDIRTAAGPRTREGLFFAHIPTHSCATCFILRQMGNFVSPARTHML